MINIIDNIIYTLCNQTLFLAVVIRCIVHSECKIDSINVCFVIVLLSKNI